MTPSIDFAARLLQDIDRDVQAWKDSIALGRCESYDAYKYAVGRIAGCETTRQMVMDRLGAEGRQALGLSQ